MGRLILNGKDYSGLIDAQGVFIDTENVITSGTWSNSYTYTATQDCVVVIGLASISSGIATITVDGETVQGIYSTSSSAVQETYCIFLKKGQVLVATSGYAAWTARYAVYGIQMGSNVTFLSEYASACYDTNEREVGCWVDGKPIYKKTWLLTIPNASGTYSFSETTPNLDKVIHTEYSLFGIGERGYVPWYNDATILFSEQTSSYIEFYFANSNYAGRTIYYTSYYTKTTDVAGSGNLTPTATPTHHYSTDEKVIGTWIDGKPLYEKTYSLTSGIAIDTYGYISMPSDSIIRRFEGYAYRSNHASVDKFNGYVANGELFATIRSGDIEYWISNIFNPVEEIEFTVQYTKTTD